MKLILFKITSITQQKGGTSTSGRKIVPTISYSKIVETKTTRGRTFEPTTSYKRPVERTTTIGYTKTIEPIKSYIKIVEPTSS